MGQGESFPSSHHFIFRALRERDYYPHFTDEEPKAKVVKQLAQTQTHSRCEFKSGASQCLNHSFCCLGEASLTMR